MIIMTKRGRPARSEVRDRVIALVTKMGKAYGYEIHKRYCQEFTPVSQRLVYYHLHQAVKMGLLKIAATERTQGDYSWGMEAEKTWYTAAQTTSSRT
jgi:DNA-binding PadR family transcriptional regulator